MKSITKRKPKKLELVPAGYRYNIKKRLADYTVQQKSAIMLYVVHKSGATVRTVYSHINESGTTQHNNVKILSAFAEKFGCSIDDLFNK